MIQCSLENVNDLIYIIYIDFIQLAVMFKNMKTNKKIREEGMCSISDETKSSTEHLFWCFSFSQKGTAFSTLKDQIVPEEPHYSYPVKHHGHSELNQNISPWGKQWDHSELTWWVHRRPTHSDLTASMHIELTGIISQITASLWCELQTHSKLTV